MSIYGIDFGCSKACIAVIGEDGIPIIVQNYADGTHAFAVAKGAAIYGQHLCR